MYMFKTFIVKGSFKIENFKFKICAVLALLAILSVVASPAHAQDISSGVATQVIVSDKNVQDGDIISFVNNKYIRSVAPYDPQIFGVVSLKPAVYLYDKTVTNGVPVIGPGKAFVRVSTINGNIKVGDFITTSTIPGAGMKLTDNGYVLGIANESYSSTDPKKIGKILVTINPHLAQITSNIVHTLLTLPRLSFTATLLNPIIALRYLFAATVAAGAFFIGFRFFGSASARGIEAIGRNPLARRPIIISIIFNVILAIAVIAAGIAVAYLMLLL